MPSARQKTSCVPQWVIETQARMPASTISLLGVPQELAIVLIESETIFSVLDVYGYCESVYSTLTWRGVRICPGGFQGYRRSW